MWSSCSKFQTSKKDKKKRIRRRHTTSTTISVSLSFSLLSLLFLFFEVFGPVALQPTTSYFKAKYYQNVVRMFGLVSVFKLAVFSLSRYMHASKFAVVWARCKICVHSWTHAKLWRVPRWEICHYVGLCSNYCINFSCVGKIYYAIKIEPANLEPDCVCDDDGFDCVYFFCSLREKLFHLPPIPCQGQKLPPAIIILMKLTIIIIFYTISRSGQLWRWEKIKEVSLHL